MDKNKNVKKTISLYHNWTNNKYKGSNVLKICAMYRGVCLYVKARIFFIKNNGERERLTRSYIHVYVCGM